MNLKINYPNLVQQLLPPYKRQPPRLVLLEDFIEPLQVLFEEFNVWRDNSRTVIGVNSQVEVLEEYPHKKYNEPVRIRVVTYNSMFLSVGLSSEGRAIWSEFGLTGENCSQFVPLENEVRDRFDGTDFVVYIPLEVDKVLIEAEIEKYRQTLTTYRIIQK